MIALSHTAELKGATFVDVDLRDARFVDVDLSGSVMRAEEIRGTGIDAPCPSYAEVLETSLSRLPVILQEEWEHRRYAERDLDAIEAESKLDELI